MIRTLQMLVRAAAAAFALLVCAEPAGACSMGIEYVRPRNYELVQSADAIVVATPVAQANGRPSVSFRIESALKGSPPATVNASNSTLEAPPGDRSEPSTVWAFMCGGTRYRSDRRYLLLLRKLEDGVWDTLQYGFPGDDDGYSGDSPWTRTVRRYIQLQSQFGAMEQLERLKRMLATRKGLSGETLSEAELDDIGDHLASLSPYKPTPFLMAAWARLERGEPDEFGPSPVLAKRMKTLHRQGQVPDSTLAYVPDLSSRRRSLLLALVNGDHPDALPLFDKLIASPSTVPGELGLALRFLAKNGQYPRAFRWIETKLMNLLPILPEREAVTLIGDVAAAQKGDSPDEGEERWRLDPRSAAVWPEIALALYWHQIRSHGEIYSEDFMDAIRAVRVPDYRARPLVTLAWAGDYEDEVSEWAVAELRDDAKRKAWETLPVDPDYPQPPENDPAWLPLKVVLTGWRKENETFLAEIFCQSDRRRRLLISMLGTDSGTSYMDALARIGATPNLSKDEQRLLAEAIVRNAVHHADAPGNWMDISLEDGPARILENLRRNRGGTPAPIVCRR